MIEIDSQQRAIDHLIKHFESKDVGILAGVSGLGKSTVASRIAEKLGLNVHQAEIPYFSHDPILIDAPPRILL